MSNFFTNAGRANLGNQLNSVTDTLLKLRQQKIDTANAGLKRLQISQALQTGRLEQQKLQNQLIKQEQIKTENAKRIPIETLPFLKGLAPELKTQALELAYKTGHFDRATGTTSKGDMINLAGLIESDNKLFTQVSDLYIKDARNKYLAAQDAVTKIETKAAKDPGGLEKLKDNKEYIVAKQQLKVAGDLFAKRTDKQAKHLKLLNQIKVQGEVSRNKKVDTTNQIKNYNFLVKKFKADGVPDKEARRRATNLTFKDTVSPILLAEIRGVTSGPLFGLKTPEEQQKIIEDLQTKFNRTEQLKGLTKKDVGLGDFNSIGR